MTKKDQAKVVKPKRITFTKALKEEVFARDGFICKNCGRSLEEHPKLKFELGHIISVADGGTNTAANLRVLCRDCNRETGKKLTEEGKAHLPQIEYVSTKDIEIPSWNPIKRIDEIKYLAGDIRTYGILQPLLVGKDGLVADGSRRLTAARTIGLGVVPIIRRTESASLLWKVANTNTRRLGPSDWCKAIVQGFDPDEAPPKIGAAYSQLVHMLGEEDANRMFSIASDRVWYFSTTIAQSLKMKPLYEGQKKILSWVLKGGTFKSLENLSKAYRNTGDEDLRIVALQALDNNINIVDPGILGEALVS